MNRFKAAGIHLGISIVIALATLSWLRLVWYPGALFTLMGGLALLVIMLSVDVVIGPLITLIVFDLKKENLKWDLMCIAALQISALCYGIYTMWLARPVWIAYAHHEFQVVAVPDVTGELKDAKYPAYQHLPIFGPKWIGIVPDKALKGRFEVEVGLSSGAKISVFPAGWEPYDKVKPDVLTTAHPLEQLAKEDGGKRLLQRIKAQYGQNQPPVWLPLSTRTGRGIVLIDPVKGLPIETLAL